MDYPPSQAALAVIKGGVARRFEFYVSSPAAAQSEVVELCKSLSNFSSNPKLTYHPAGHGRSREIDADTFKNCFQPMQGQCVRVL